MVNQRQHQVDRSDRLRNGLLEQVLTVGRRGGAENQMALIPDEDDRGQLVFNPLAVGDKIIEHQELRLIEDGARRLVEAGNLFRRVAELEGQRLQIELPTDSRLFILVGIT